MSSVAHESGPSKERYRRCRRCGYVGRESTFIAVANRRGFRQRRCPRCGIRPVYGEGLAAFLYCKAPERELPGARAEANQINGVLAIKSVFASLLVDEAKLRRACELAVGLVGRHRAAAVYNIKRATGLPGPEIEAEIDKVKKEVQP